MINNIKGKDYIGMDLRNGKGRAHQYKLYRASSGKTFSHEMAHHLGNMDEYVNWAKFRGQVMDMSKFEEGSLMHSGAKVYARHFKEILNRFNSKNKGASGCRVEMVK